jgi:hypothetical protein
MHFTILRMISNNSLSAFSIGSPVAGAQAAGRVNGPAAFQQARAQQQASQPAGSGASLPGGRVSPQSLAPGQILPRGSLLDLSV